MQLYDFFEKLIQVRWSDESLDRTLRRSDLISPESLWKLICCCCCWRQEEEEETRGCKERENVGREKEECSFDSFIKTQLKDENHEKRLLLKAGIWWEPKEQEPQSLFLYGWEDQGSLQNESRESKCTGWSGLISFERFSSWWKEKLQQENNTYQRQVEEEFC